MHATAYIGAKKISGVEIEPSPPAPGEVQIAVSYTGLCGTDLHILHGDMDARVGAQHVFGHEASGIVAAVGEHVRDWQLGDRVTVMPLDWDGSCPACLVGNEHICQNLNFIGVDSAGALQELWNVPARTLVGLPKDLHLRTAALVEPLAVAVHDVRRSELVPGDKVIVIGAGPIGVLIACVARYTGADVTVIEVDDARRAAAGNLGFNTLSPRDDDQDTWIQRWTDGAGADAVFEVSGSPSAVLASTGLVKVRGTVVVVAIHPTPREIDLQRIFWRELRILGARVYQRQDFETAIDLLSRRALPVNELITKVVPLSQTESALHELEEGRAMKILVDVAGKSEPAI